jgi:hypothetical protein
MTVARVPCMGEDGKELTEEADQILRDFELKQRAMNRVRALIITSQECLDYYQSLRESKSKKGVSSSTTKESGENVKKPKLPALKTVSKEVHFRFNCSGQLCSGCVCRRLPLSQSLNQAQAHRSVVRNAEFQCQLGVPPLINWARNMRAPQIRSSGKSVA